MREPISSHEDQRAEEFKLILHDFSREPSPIPMTKLDGLILYSIGLALGLTLGVLL